MEKLKKLSVLCGVCVGAVNGLFGGGGGMICVPLLGGALSYPRKQAHATAILVILPICAVSALFYVAFGYVEWEVIIPAAAGNILGGLIGAKALGFSSESVTEIIFIIVMSAAGIRMAIG